MPIKKMDWELHITRIRVDVRKGRRRTVGRYQVYHDGVAVKKLAGYCAEPRGPGDNSVAGNKLRIETGRYPLLTQAGEKYVTIGYTPSRSFSALPRPGIELGNTDKREEILIHPGRGFLSSVGCINPCGPLAGTASDMDFAESREKVIALIEDLKAYLKGKFPAKNGKAIPNAFVVVDGEP